MRTDGRIATSISIAMVSNPALTKTATAVTSLVVTPLLEVLLLVAISASVGSPDLRDTAYAGVVLAFGLTVLTGTVEQITRDRQLGVLQEIIGYGLANPAYWVGKLAVPMTLGIVPALAGALVVFGLDESRDIDALTLVLLLIPVAAISGGLVGLTAAIASLALSDPYVISNAAHSVLLITAGVVLPLNAYPGWLGWIAHFLPFTAVIEALRIESSVIPLVVREMCIALVWFGVSIVIGRRVMAALRSGKRAQEVW